MLRGILPDANCDGHFEVVLRVLHDDERREFWHYLNLAMLTFQDLAPRSFRSYSLGAVPAAGSDSHHRQSKRQRP
jgi:hypothetical protein